MAPREGLARRLVSAPGQKFSYDNTVVTLTTAVVDKVAGMPLAVYARQELGEPLGFKEPV